MVNFDLGPSMDTNGIKMLTDQLERGIQHAMRKELTERLVAQSKVDIEEEITSLISRFTLEGVEKMCDVLKWRDELRVFLSYRNEDGVYKIPKEYYDA